MSEFTIERDGKTITLTGAEVMDIYYKQQHDFDCQDIINKLEDLEDSFEEDSLLKKYDVINCPAAIEIMANEHRKNLDNGMEFDYSRSEVIEHFEIKLSCIDDIVEKFWKGTDFYNPVTGVYICPGPGSRSPLYILDCSPQEAVELSKQGEKENTSWLALIERQKPDRFYKKPSLTEYLELFPDETRHGWLPADQYHKQVQSKKKEKSAQPVR